jgi:hypothetical protein
VGDIVINVFGGTLPNRPTKSIGSSGKVGNAGSKPKQASAEAHQSNSGSKSATVLPKKNVKG